MKRLLTGVVLFGILASAAQAAYPVWWVDRGLVNPASGAVNDFAAANQGQLKWVAAKACEEMNANLPGGAGSAVNALIAGFTTNGNFNAVNLGQLKYVAAPFYDRLIALGIRAGYPWSAEAGDDNDFAAANLGQVKFLFNFEFIPAIGTDPEAISHTIIQGHNISNDVLGIWNRGLGTINYGMTTGGEPWFSIAPTNGTSTGATNAHTLSYAADGLSVGTYTGVISIASATATNSPQAVSVVVTVIPETRIIRLEGNLAFGTVMVGSTSNLTLFMANDGNTPLNVSGISYPVGFTGNWSGAIPAGATQEATVTFAPVVPGAYTGLVTVASDATSGVATRAITGTAIPVPTRIIRLEGDLDFGDVILGSSSDRTLSIFNDGNATLTVASVTWPAGFSGNWSGGVAPGSWHEVTGTFTPVLAASYTGLVTVASDATSGTGNRPVSGNGLAQTRIVRVDGDSNFGILPLGQSSLRTLTIVNDGNSAMLVSAVNCPTGFACIWSGSIGAGGSANVAVTFTPTQSIVYAGAFVVASDATSGSGTKGVIGRGTVRSGDFDGDGLSDIGCYLPPNGLWYRFISSLGFRMTQFGYAGTLPLVGDFDGDGRADFGCYYPPTGRWHLMQSREGFWETQFGYAGTVPVVGDFDGDGRCDFGCYDAPRGKWYLFRSREGFWETTFGYAGTVPVVGDFDGDGRCDFGCYDAPRGKWYLFKSREGFWETQFGYAGTVPVVGDFDGDGRCDFGCYDAPRGKWYLFKSRDGFWETQFGYAGTVPVVGDFDGDGLSDMGCYFPPAGMWYLLESAAGFRQFQFGPAGTAPIPLP